MRNYKVTPTTWLNDNEFVGTATKRVKYSRDGGLTWIEEDDTVAVYGWTREDRAGIIFSIYTIRQGHISKLGTMRRPQLLDFRTLKV